MYICKSAYTNVTYLNTSDFFYKIWKKCSDYEEILFLPDQGGIE